MASPSLRPVTAQPFNAEAPLAALLHPVTPLELCYVRNHFDTPYLDADTHRVTVDGAVARSAGYSLADLQAMGSHTVTMTLECAGNGRSLLSPAVPGTPWGLGAVAFVEFTGVPLEAVLDDVGLEDRAVDLVFTGADEGETVPGDTESYAFSLSPDDVTEDVLLAWEMNGESLAPNHGAPLRLVVPGTYGMASVKWLVGIHAATESFDGHFRREYRYRQSTDIPDENPVQAIRVRSLIVTPGEGEGVSAGGVVVAGVAWSGSAPITRVEVSSDDGHSWSKAMIEESAGPYGPQRWSIRWEATPGVHVLVARATDGSGDRQPMQQLWNRNGYGNNVVHRVIVAVT